MSTYWEPEYGIEPEPPEPCQYCSLMAGMLIEHDGRCNSMTKEQFIELTKAEE